MSGVFCDVSLLTSGGASDTRLSHLFTHTHTHSPVRPRAAYRHMLWVRWYAIVPFIHSVKHDTCITGGWILELCVLTPYVSEGPPIPSNKHPVSVCHQGAHVFIVLKEILKNLGMYCRLHLLRYNNILHGSFDEPMAGSFFRCVRCICCLPEWEIKNCKREAMLNV